MMREMTAEQFNEWIAFYQIEPFGVLVEDEEWADWKSLYMNMHMKKGKRIKKDKFLLFGEKKKDASDLFELDEYDEFLDDDEIEEM